MKRHWNRHRPLFANTLPTELTKPKVKWRIFPIIWLALKRMATVLGFIILLNVFLGLLLSFFVAPSGQKLPAIKDQSVLLLKLDNDFSEVRRFGGFSDPFAKPEPTLKEITDAIDAAAKDKRISGIVARMNGGSFDLSHSFELRAALQRFKQSGKFTYIYSSSYGEGGGGLGRYYLASVFDQIWMQPLGVVSIAGVSAEIPFARETLDKIGVTPQFFQRKEYKSAMETFTNKEISAANKEEMSAIVNDIRTQILKEVPAERKMSAAQFEALVNKGLLTAEEAQKSGLIDQANYADALLEQVALKLKGEPDSELVDLVDVTRYIAATRASQAGALEAALQSGKPKVALVYAVGAIVPSNGDDGLGSDAAVVAADELAPLLFDIAEDNDIRAVVLRIDSPGGSPTASESILRAVQKVQAKGKPVIVSMGTAAASGGYWIASGADKIYALPTTLTGSIGVFGGKVVIDGLSDKIGVNWTKISWGKNAGLWSMNTPFSESEAERMNAMMDQIYDAFTDRVAKGRKMNPADVEKVARGRVWTGARAAKNGLVDEIGGLNEALDYAATLTGKKTRDDVNIQIMPKPKTQIELLMEFLGEEVSLGFGGRFDAALETFFGGRAEQVLRAIDMQAKPENYGVYEPLRITD